MTTEEDKKKDQYKNRRRMAWASLIFLIVLGLCSMFLGAFSNVDILRTIIRVLSAVVLTYMGGVAVLEVTAKIWGK